MTGGGDLRTAIATRRAQALRYSVADPKRGKIDDEVDRLVAQLVAQERAGRGQEPGRRLDGPGSVPVG